MLLPIRSRREADPPEAAAGEDATAAAAGSAPDRAADKKKLALGPLPGIAPRAKAKVGLAPLPIAGRPKVEQGPEIGRIKSNTLESPRSVPVTKARVRMATVRIRERVSIVDITPVSVHESADYLLEPWVNIKREDFKVLKWLGSGGFGEVKLVRYDMDGLLYAMKSVDKAMLLERKKLGDDKATEGQIMERDFGVLARQWQSECPFIVQLHATFQTAGKLHYIYEFCSGGELFDLLRAQPTARFALEHARFYLAEVILALEMLHRHDVTHRDVKLDNILLVQDGHVKLSDFGSVRAQIPSLRTEDDSMTQMKSTRSMSRDMHFGIFMPPEFRRGEAYGKELDCWQLGVVVFAMLSGTYPDFLKAVPDRLPLPDDTPEAAVALCAGLLKQERRERLGFDVGASALRDHCFFEAMDWKAAERREIEAPFKFEECDSPMRGYTVVRSDSLAPGPDIMRVRNFTWCNGPYLDEDNKDDGFSSDGESREPL
eukprot:TRINITY_DN40349_c0_g1_i1.p1 TRINITY_DN40349_c0_g1~~TRINITY_DN40349_c0_g1_i1.p1  ORF type:complete len:487 (-),score=134.54 TRINITY_DN40349_c0_g1_i1:90-1550(-)